MLCTLSLFKRALNEFLAALYAVIALSVSGLLLILLTSAWSLIALFLHILLPTERAQRLSRRGISSGFRLYITILQRLGWLISDTEEVRSLNTEPPMVIAPNHPGLLDAVLILTQLPSLGLVLKASLLNHPLFGVGARIAGYIPNNRTLAMIRESRQNLANGQHLLLFPEGTRTLAPPINPLTNSCALVALKSLTPIQTILIESPSGYLGKSWPITKPPRIPVRIKLRLGRRFPPTGNARQLTECLETYFRQAL